MVGVDRDAIALAKARSWSGAACTTNVRFVEADLTDLQIDGDFDAIVGRFVLMFLPDPIATLRSLARRLRPGGVIVFQEPSWNGFLVRPNTCRSEPLVGSSCEKPFAEPGPDPIWNSPCCAA